MDLSKFQELVVEQQEREKVVSWCDLQEFGPVQLLSVVIRNSRYGRCFLATAKSLDGVLVKSWVNQRFLNEVRRKFTDGDSVYFLSTGTEKFQDTSAKVGNKSKSRNCYNVQLIRDGKGIPFEKLFEEGIWNDENCA